MPRTQILARHCCCRPHQSDGRPGNEREELGVGHRERALRRCALRERSDERQHQHPADVHRDSLNPGGQPEAEQLLDDGPVRTEPTAARKGDHPTAAPQLPECVERHDGGRDACAHGRASRPECGNGPETPDEDDIEDEIHDRHRDAEDHRGSRIPRRAQRSAQHEEDHHAARKPEHDAQIGLRFRLHRRSRVHDLQKPGRREVSYRRQDPEGNADRREERLVHDTVDLVRLTGSCKPRHEHTHPREKR